MSGGIGNITAFYGSNTLYNGLEELEEGEYERRTYISIRQLIRLLVNFFFLFESVLRCQTGIS